MFRFPLLRLEELEDRTLLSATLGTSYNGISSAQQSALTGLLIEPPDTNGAAGPTNYVETANQAVAIFNPKTSGAAPVTRSLADFYFTQGGLTPAAAAGSDGQSDNFVIFDSQVQRFIVGDIDFDTSNKNGEVNNLLLAVSKSASPATLTKADWFFYEIPTTEGAVALQDYPGNPGYNADALVVTLLSFPDSGPPIHSQVNAISMKALVSGTALTLNTNYFQTVRPNLLNLRPTVMPDSTPGGPMWLLAENGSNSSIDVIRMDNVLSAAPTFTTTSVAVNPYSTAVPELQPDGSQITTATDSRILNAVEANGQIVAAHIVSNAAGNLDNARWYQFSVSSGTPTLVQQGDVSGGPGVYDAYPSIAINAQGTIGMSYIQSGTGAGQFMSTYVTGRTATDAPGTMEAPVLVQAGAGNYRSFGGSNPGREGDLSGINVDSDGSFWIANEFANTDPDPNWGTVIAHFSVGAPFQITLTSAVEGQPLTLAPVATFIDSSGSGAGAFQATIFWGDGASSPGTITGKGLFTIKGTHTYTEEGAYTLSVTLSKGNLVLGTVSGTVLVADAPLIAGPAAPPLTSSVGSFLNDVLVGSFTDTDPTNTPTDPQNDPADYIASVTFFQANGLSITVPGRIVPNGGNTFLVYASNPVSFATNGTFVIHTVARDVGGASVSFDTSVSVSGKPAIPHLVPQFGADRDAVNPIFFQMQNALTNLLAAENILIASFVAAPPVQLRAFINFVFAEVAYQIAVFRFDLTLPFGG